MSIKLTYELFENFTIFLGYTDPSLGCHISNSLPPVQIAVSIKDMKDVTYDVYMGYISIIKLEPNGDISIISTREFPVSYTAYKCNIIHEK
jgi:hypothetical protein